MVLVSQFVRTWDGATAPCQVLSGSPDLGHECAWPRPTPGQGHGRRSKDDDRCPAARCNSETFRSIFGLPGKNQNESLQKTDC